MPKEYVVIDATITETRYQRLAREQRERQEARRTRMEAEQRRARKMERGARRAVHDARRRMADAIDGFDRDDLGLLPDY